MSTPRVLSSMKFALQTAVRSPARLHLGAQRPSTIFARFLSEPTATQPINPGGRAGEIASDLEQATGPRYIEALAAAHNRVRYNREPLTGDFGTLEKPVLVESGYDSRIVGCLGGQAERAHGLLWFELNRGRPHACSVCGQVFKLIDPIVVEIKGAGKKGEEKQEQQAVAAES